MLLLLLTAESGFRDVGCRNMEMLCRTGQTGRETRDTQKVTL